MHFPLCPWGWRQGVAPPKALHIAATWRGNPSFVMFALAVAIAIAVALANAVAVANSVAIAVAIVIAIALAHRHCCCRQPFPLRSPSLSRCRQPSLLLSPLLSAIAISVTVCHRSCHCHRPSPLLCRYQFPRVVALARQELYSTKAKNAYLPHNNQ